MNTKKDNVKAGRPTKEKTEKYIVETRGYSEVFEDRQAAKDQRDILKKRAIKNKEAVSIKVYKNSKDKNNLVDSVNITEEFYGEE